METEGAHYYGMNAITPESTRYDNLDPNPRALTPESVIKENVSDRVYSYSKKYGETISTLKPGFESKVEKYEGVYEVAVPEEVLKVCKEIYGIGGRALLVGGSVRDAVISTEFPEMHLKPKEFWEKEVKKGIDQTSAIRRLSKRLSDADSKTYADGGDSNIYMLALVAEADQRGRNGEGITFLARESVPELEEWQSWLIQRSKELKVEQRPPEMLLTGKIFLKEFRGKNGGPWLGAVLDAVYADQLDGNVTSLEAAVINGQAYFEIFSQKVRQEAQVTNKPEGDVWAGIRRLEDPRVFLYS